jgi:hypothetical protein
MGSVVQAHVLSPPPGEAAPLLPSGTQLTLRVAVLPTAPAAAAQAAASAETATPLPAEPAPQGADLTGTVLSTTAAETIVDTPIGLLTLERRLALPPGTLLSLERLAAAPPDEPATLPLAQRTTWPALDETLSVLDRALPALAQQLRSELAPASGQALAGTLLFLMSALSTGVWPGMKAAAALDGAGRRDLRLKLDGDVAELRQLAASSSGDWRVYVLPLLDGATVRPVRLYFRRRSSGAAPGEPGTRFVLEVDMTRLGALQLDGLVRPQRLDLVLRSHRAIPAELREGIGEIFRNATTAAGLAGDIIFAAASRFAVAPLDALRQHVGVTA